jgi:hypothetical protein
MDQPNPTSNPNYHSASDTLDTLNLGFHADVTRGLVATIDVLANE